MRAIVGLLKPQQRFLANEFSQLVINESSGFNSSSPRDEYEDKILD